MRKSNRTVLNRMSKWQYALLLLMLLTFTFYSLPTFLAADVAERQTPDTGQGDRAT